MAQTLEAEIENRNRIAIIDLRGEISSLAEKSLLEAYEQANGRRSEIILLNMENVDYINSAGIALIIRLVADARQRDCLVAVSGLTDHYQEIFRITRLDDYVTLYRDRESALEELADK